MNAAELVSPPGRPVGPEVLAEIEKLAFERALGSKKSGFYGHRGRKGIGEGGSLPRSQFDRKGAAIGIITMGGVEVVGVYDGQDPQDAMHHYAFPGLVIPPQRKFRFDRGVVQWDDNPSPEDYWTVDDYFGGAEHVVGWDKMGLNPPRLKAAGGPGSGHHKHRGRKGIAEGGSLPDTAIGVIYGGAVEVVNLHGKDPNKAMHEHAFDEDRASVWPGQRFRYRRGVVVWDDTPEDDDYWAVDNYFNGPKHITGINHLPVPMPAPLASPEPPNPFTSSDLGVVTAHGEVVVEEGAAFFAEHADAFPTVRDPSRRFRFIKGEVWWSDRPDASSYWAVDNRYGGVRHRYWKGSDLLDIKPPEPTALGGPGSGDKLGHPFRGNQWTDASVDETDLAATKARLDTLHGELSKLSSGPNTAAAIKERLRRNAPLIAEIQRLDHVLHPNTASAITATAVLKPIEGGAFAVHHGGSVLGTLHPIAYTGFSTVNTAQQMRRKTGWKALYGTEVVSGQAATKQAALYAIAWAHSLALKERTLGDRPGHEFHGNQYVSADGTPLTPDEEIAEYETQKNITTGTVQLWRGTVGDVDATTPRPGYIATFSTNRRTADTYSETGARPFAIDLDAVKVIEFPVRKATIGTGNEFDKFAFDRAARGLGPGEVLVARNVYDTGPRGSTERDPHRLHSYPSDIYATNTKVARALGDKKGHPFRGNQWTGPDPAEDAPQNFDFASQAEQFDRIGPPGISVQREVMPGRTRVIWSRSNLMQGRERKDPDSVIDILKYRDKSGKMLGVLYHYPTGVPGYQSRGSVNVLVSPKAQRQGIATSLLKEGIKRWKIKLEGQSYTSEGRQFIVSYLEKQRRRSLGDKPGHEFHGNQWVHGFALKQYVRHQLVPKFGHVVGEEDDKVVVRWEGGRESAVSPKMIMAVKEPALPEEREKSELEELDED